MFYIFQGSTVKLLPMLIFGACSIGGGLMVLLLPETRGCDLPDVIEDVQDSQRFGTYVSTNKKK